MRIEIWVADTGSWLRVFDTKREAQAWANEQRDPSAVRIWNMMSD